MNIIIVILLQQSVHLIESEPKHYHLQKDVHRSCMYVYRTNNSMCNKTADSIVGSCICGSPYDASTAVAAAVYEKGLFTKTKHNKLSR